MKFLSSRRRHPAAKPLLLLVALFLVGGLYAVVAPSTQSSADTGNSQMIEEGKDLYAVGCSSCHGMNGEGGTQGPSLVGVGGAAVDFQVGTGRMPMAQQGIQAPRKQVLYTQEQIDQLAAYVHSLGPGPAIPEEEQYTTEGLSEEQIARGGELFRTNCSACHNFEGSGGAMPNGKEAPTLKDVDPRHIYGAMRTGPQEMPVFSKEVISDEDARSVIAYLEELHQQPGGGLTLGGLGPVTEGFWAWVVGIGGLCLFAVWITSKGARAK